MSLEEGLKLIDEVRAIFGAGSQLVLSGGEPLLRPDVYELVEYASSLGLRVALASNGTLIDLEVARKLKQAGLDELAISIDGATKTSHDHIRGVQGAFDAAIQGALNAKKTGLSLQLHFTLMESNVNELPSLIELAEHLQARRLFIFDLIPTGRGAFLKPHGLDPLALFDYLFKEQRRFKVWLKPQCYPYFWVYLLSKAGDLGVDEEVLKGYFKGCLAGRSMVRVSPDGEVTPCPFLPVSVGNVKKDRLSYLWRSSKVFEELRSRDKFRDACGGCVLKEVCGGCRAKAYALLNDYLAEDPSCPYAHAPSSMSRA